MKQGVARAVGRSMILAGLVWSACGSIVSATSYVTKPTVTWLASSVPVSSRIEMSKVVATNSTAKLRFKTFGPCLVKGELLITEKAGRCKIELQLGATSRFAAISSATTLQVKKPTELTVLGTASLADALDIFGKQFMARYLNVTVKNSFAGSATLATQIRQGAPVDIVAMADTANMQKVVSSGDIDNKSVTILVRNKLAILVQRGNPQKIFTLVDLSRSGLKVVLCDLAQPCGKYAATVLKRANISLSPASREISASGVVMRVGLGEADAGIAYLTDGLAVGDKVDAVAIADSSNLVADYPIGVATRPTTNDATAITAFMTMIRGESGRKIFLDKGFILP